MILIDVHMWHTNKWWGETYCTDFDMVISDLNVMGGGPIRWEQIIKAGEMFILLH